MKEDIKDLICPKCSSNNLVLNGHNENDLQKYKCNNCGYQTTSPIIKSIIDKQKCNFSYQDFIDNINKKKQLEAEASYSQDFVKCELTTEMPYIILLPLADTHIGSFGTDYEQLRQFILALKSKPYLYTFSIGDDLDNFSKFKNMLPVLKQELTPENQDKFLEAMLKDIGYKFLFATWGNHNEFQEKLDGRSSVKRIYSENKIPYFNGMGIASILINNIEYIISPTHKTRFNSTFNKTHGLKQMARNTISGADIYISGHIHNGAYEITKEQTKTQLFMVQNSLKKDDGYARRYFSYYINEDLYCIVVNTSKKEFIPFQNLNQAEIYCKY
jgi:Zn ribbon nucleic-acid-binding protein